VVLIDAHPRHARLLRAVTTRLREEFAKLQVEVNEEKRRTVNLDRSESFCFWDSTSVDSAADIGRCGGCTIRRS
jgi:hypothetical protein